MDKTTVWITASQGARLRLLSKQQRKEQAATLEEFFRRGIPWREARATVMAMRAEHWPAMEVVVGEAVAQRLAEPDLAGPWMPLTETELGEMRLSGRWPGPNHEGALVQRNYAFPAALALQLRTASWRVSSEALSLLRAPEAWMLRKARRDELVEQLHSPARIVRQALDRYGPGATHGIDPAAV